MLFRNSSASPAWHFCRNCSGWPSEDYEEDTREPPPHLICTECTRRLTDLQCDSADAVLAKAGTE